MAKWGPIKFNAPGGGLNFWSTAGLALANPALALGAASTGAVLGGKDLYLAEQARKAQSEMQAELDRAQALVDEEARQAETTRAMRAARRRQRQQALGAQGRSADILTGPQGLGTVPTAPRAAMLGL